MIRLTRLPSLTEGHAMNRAWLHTPCQTAQPPAISLCFSYSE